MTPTYLPFLFDTSLKIASLADVASQDVFFLLAWHPAHFVPTWIAMRNHQNTPVIFFPLSIFLPWRPASVQGVPTTT
jgi:hypothetical protein